MTAPPPLTFFVAGTPAPQGSKRHVGNGVLIESSKAVKPWRDSVHHAARAAAAAARWGGVDGPAEVSLVFVLRRPLTIPKRRTQPDRKPDGDKLERATLDGLTTAGILADDARIVTLHWAKRYALPGAETGCLITVAAL